MNFINNEYHNLHNVAVNNFDRYVSFKPFPHIVLDNFFNEDVLKKIMDEFPDNLTKLVWTQIVIYKRKFALNDFSKFGANTQNLLNFTNSLKFLNFINKISGIKEPLVSDPYFLGEVFTK